MVAFLDDQNGRAKDLYDIRSILSLYEESSERIFSDAVLDANLKDFGLLEMDLRAACTADELALVQQFLRTVRDEAQPAWPAFVRAVPSTVKRIEEQAAAQLDAFRAGFDQDQ